MNLNNYLLKKTIPPVAKPERVLCLKCLKSQKSCLCAHIQPFDTRTHFVILIHPKEAKKERIGTGRLSHLCLKNSSFIMDETFDKNEKAQELLNDPSNNCFLLYPGSESHNLDTSPHPKLNTDLKNIIFVIDGTWSCAKSMMRESVTLHNLPRVSFNNTKTSNFSIKQQPSSYCLSTIESIYHVLSSLERSGHEQLDNKHVNMLEILEHMCNFQKQCAANPSLSRYRPGVFKNKDEKKPSKKWLQRKIYFD